MSYNKAWRIIHAAEERLGFALLDRSVGGSQGGGSNITPAARDLMKRYNALSAEAAAAMEEVFQRHFSDWVDPVLAEIDGTDPAD